MAKINVLPAQVYNRIAAGEVVDRPYSVVKELVENAIDAGATEIEIYIEDGGKQLIRVVDNGCGITRDDLHSAFLPHATSKITTADDLYAITTLGFRGEAVASIASVSKMTITSKVKGEKCYSLTSHGGMMGKITEASGQDGTDVRVDMLFFNTPVRLKFLKSNKTEEADITTFVSRFILSHSNIAFRYFVDGKQVLQSYGGGDEEAFVCVYGANTLAQCYKVDAEKNGVHIKGYMGNQNFSKPNKSYQCIFLNGRYIYNQAMTTAIYGAYKEYLMKRRYPFYVLFVTMSPALVDVNVHPSKTDVRFIDNSIIYGALHSVLSSILDGTAKAVDYLVPETESVTVVEKEIEKPQLDEAIIREYKENFSFSAKERENDTLSKRILENNDETISLKNAKDAFSAFTLEEAKEELKVFTENMKNLGKKEINIKGYVAMEDIPPLNPNDIATMTYQEMQERKPKKKSIEKLHRKFPDAYYERTFLRFDDPEYEKAKENGGGEDFFLANKKLLEEQEQLAKQNRIDVRSCVYVGKLFNTYLMYESGENIYIIDQHAAHERLIFDRLKEKLNNRSIIKQSMLIPYDLHTNAFEAAFIMDKIDEIRALGFDIEQRGETLFCVTSVPADLQNINMHTFFNDVLSSVNEYRAIKLEDIFRDKLASAACKAAVKGGMDLTHEEAIELLKQMQGDMGLKCPHGRPVVVKMTRTQLEKMFKRIV